MKKQAEDFIDNEGNKLSRQDQVTRMIALIIAFLGVFIFFIKLLFL